MERLLPFGPAGCPLVAETCTGRLALAFRTSTQSAKGWISDALNIRHRLPRLWERVLVGDVYAWKAREIARGTSGDITMFLALVDALAEALADEGDEDPYPVRKSKAIGIAAYPDRAQDLLSRSRHRDDPRKDPWDQVDAHHTDPTDPWADDLPTAGWETDRHSNYHQPGLDEEWGMPASGATDDEGCRPDEAPIDPADLNWYHQQTPAEPEHDGSDPDQATTTADDSAESAESTSTDAHAGELESPPTVPDPPPEPRHQSRPSGLDLRPRNLDLTKSRPTVHLHVHISDQTIRDGRGVVRTPHGPITVDQLRHFLGDTCPDVKVHPVYDPADTAAVDNYEIPIALRRSQWGVSIKNPASVFPFSPATSRMDLDHTTAYQPDGPPGQTSMGNLGPLTRSEHRAKTVGRWRTKQPDPGLYLWRSPEGQIAVTTNQGTLLLGNSAYTHHLWRTAGRRQASGNAGQASP